MPYSYNRPEGGFRYQFEGIKVNDVPDALDTKKYPYAQNIRATADNSVRTRPGYNKIFGTDANAITDIRAYSTLLTDNLPRTLAHNSINEIWLDNGSKVGTLNGSSQYAFMIPFRPNQSPQSWMYVGSQNDFQKFSAPNAANQVTQAKVGIAEQQNPPDACPSSFSFYQFTGVAADWVAGGVASGLADNSRISGTIGDIFLDPASASDGRYSIAVADTGQYSLQEVITLDESGGDYTTVIQDIIPPINNGVDINISGVYYYSGNTGRCVIVPAQSSVSGAIPTFTNNVPSALSAFAVQSVAALRRGAIVHLDNGVNTEDAMVLSVTIGPDNTIAFEVVTVYTYTSGDAVTGVGTLIVTGVNGLVGGKAINAAEISFALSGKGTGTINRSTSTDVTFVSPFVQALSPSGSIPQPSDYIGLNLQITDVSQLVSITLTFSIGTTVDYTGDALYTTLGQSELAFYYDSSSAPSVNVIISGQLYSVPGSVAQQLAFVANGATLQTIVDYNGVAIPVGDIAAAPISGNSVLPSDQWTTIFFPISSLTRVGSDYTKTLANCNGVQVSIQVIGAVNAAISGLFVGGGGQPDVGNNGTPYFYAVRARASLSGAVSNPSPISRYGVSPRRQQVEISMTDTTGDPQFDTWDIYRFGGTVNSFRYIGSTANTGTLDTFLDTYFDNQANAGTPIDYTQYEPWPSIDVPYNPIAGTVSGITTTITVTGTTVLVVYSSSGAFTNPAPSTILRWLPGTELLVDGLTAFTLFNRPQAVNITSPPAHYYAYLFQLVENAGYLVASSILVLEPNVANQNLPYLWGPDATGTLFAAGDDLRPGFFYFSAPSNPDGIPNNYNQELVPPSEPILGGEALDGLSFISTSDRWFALYPNFGGTPRYQAVERPVGRPLAAPAGKCTDGKNIYFFAKDGVWAIGSSFLVTGNSLTDADLYNIFPHEGVPGSNISYGGYTVYAVDYQYASDFRLSFIGGYLYADYRDSTGTPRTLVCDLRNPTKPKWSVDAYGSAITTHYAIEQQESTLASTSSLYPLLLMGDGAGNVHEQEDLANDNGVAIMVAIATFEYNFGDLRQTNLVGDLILDCVPASGLNAAPVSQGMSIVAPVAVPKSATRVINTNIPIGVESKYCGLILQWTDNFTSQTVPTSINAWQPLYQAVPIALVLWICQSTSFGMDSYGHIRQVNFAYRSTASVILTVTSYDGQSPAAITMPATGGTYRKTLFPFTPNKGMLFKIQAQSSDGSQWTPYLGDCEWSVGPWNRQGPYTMFKDIPGPDGVKS